MQINRLIPQICIPAIVTNTRQWRIRVSCRRRRNGIVHSVRRRCLRVTASATSSKKRPLTKPGKGTRCVNMVYKFGGSSIADVQRMEAVAEIICSFPEYYPCIVLSAMGNTTNLLIDSGKAALATSPDQVANIPEFIQITERHHEAANAVGLDSAEREIVEELLSELKQLLTGVALMHELTPRAKDTLVSFGERMSTVIFTGLLKNRHIDAVQFDAWDLGFVSTDDFTNSDVILDATLPSIKKTMASLNGEIPVVTGFLARGQKSGAITTLGRGGSDLTATIIGLALGVSEVQVWKDVDGVLTSDPRLVPSAVPLPVLTYEEASELAYFGAQVLHPRAMKPAILSKDAMSVRVKNSYNKTAPGTVIQSKRDLSKTLLTTIVVKRGISVVDIVSTRMVGQFGFLAKVFQVFKENQLSVNVVATSEISVSTSLDVDRFEDKESEKAETLMSQFEGWAEVSLRKNLAIVSLICNIQRSSEILEVVFRCLREQRINVQMISQGASKTNISLIVHTTQVDQAVKTIHDQFFS